MEPDSSFRSLLEPLRESQLELELGRIQECAAAVGCEVFLVGGLVRDLLLGHDSTDIDLVTTQEPDLLLAALQKSLGGKWKRWPDFLTAKLRSSNGFDIDVVRARSETYEFPGALPTVRPDTLEEDLRRRDFTVNSLALSLTEPDKPLVDLCGGLEDLRMGLLRAHHPDSFCDDPTRVLRGVRLAVVLGLRFESSTGALARSEKTRRALTRVSGFRLWRELASTFREGEIAGSAVSMIAELDLERVFHPSLAIDERMKRAISGLGSTDLLEVLARWSGNLRPGELQELAKRLSLGRRALRALESLHEVL